MEEKKVSKVSGFIGLFLFFVCIIIVIFGCATLDSMGILWIILAGFVGCLILTSFTIVAPNNAKVVTFFGNYLGTIRETGFWMTRPFSGKQTISLRVRNFNSEKLKVNDLEGNPIEIACIISYQVIDPAKAAFDVENYEKFVQLQSETGIRHVASMHAYDDFDGKHELTLRQHSDEVGNLLKEDLQARFAIAGVEVKDARIMHLAYASEIAAAMLQRQQATAILAARKQIVEGAVSMVKSTLEQLERDNIVQMDEAKKAQLVNNLMVALVSEKASQPVINAGSGN